MEEPSIEIRVATPADRTRALAVYERWGYKSSVQPADSFFIAERGAEVVGVVRLALEHGVWMLRGMRVDPAEQRRGTGTRLLHALVSRLGDEDECYCVPFDHLLGFYGQVGFVEASLNGAPAFLVERIAGYRARGDAVTLMRRPALAESRSRRSI